MLGAVVGQDRIGEVALQQLRAPSFPFAHKLDKFIHFPVSITPAQQFGCAWW